MKCNVSKRWSSWKQHLGSSNYHATANSQQTMMCHKGTTFVSISARLHNDTQDIREVYRGLTTQSCSTTTGFICQFGNVRMAQTPGLA